MPGRALILVENLSVPFDRRVWQEATTLRDHGWDVEVICPLGTDRDTEREAVVDGVAIHRYPLEAASGGPQGYLRSTRSALFDSIRLARAITAAPRSTSCTCATRRTCCSSSLSCCG